MNVMGLSNAFVLKNRLIISLQYERNGSALVKLDFLSYPENSERFSSSVY